MNHYEYSLKKFGSKERITCTASHMTFGGLCLNCGFEPDKPAMNRYRNLWHKSLNIPKPEFYENKAKKIGEHRGVSVFKLFEHGFDFVLNGACITQRAGASKMREVIDEILDGKQPVSDEVANHLTKCGFKPLAYRDAA